MKRRKSVLTLVLILILTISMSTVAFASVKISRKNITIAINASRWLHVDGTKKKVTWKSTNTKVVTVRKTGSIVGKKAGKATVVAKVGGKNYKCAVTVLSDKQIANRVLSKVRTKFKSALINDYYRSGSYLNVFVSRPQGEGAFWIIYRVNLKNGKAVVDDYATWRDLWKPAPRTMTVF